MPGLYQVYTRYIPTSKYIPGIYLVFTDIYLVYTRFLPGTNFDVGIYLVYTWYISDIYIKFLLKQNLDTWWQVQRRRTGSHSTRGACNNTSRPRDDSDFITPPTPTLRARLELKIACKFLSWKARHTKRCSVTGPAAFMLSMTMAPRKQECRDQSIPPHTCVRNLHLSTVS